MKRVENVGFAEFMLSDEAVSWLEERLGSEVVVDSWGWDGIEMSDPLLVECVEALESLNASGATWASDYACELVVVEE